MNANIEKAMLQDNLSKVYKWLEEAVNNVHENPQPYHVSNECNMINNIVLGMTAKKYRELHNIVSVSTEHGIRGYLTIEQLKAIDYLRTINIGLIKAGLSYQDRKIQLTKEFSSYQNTLQPIKFVIVM